jgi:type II secretory pathway pseudopilin PulG
LLVVIGIIAVLISLLMPALAAARRSATSVKCESNLHQIGQSIYAFAMAHNGRVPANQSGPYGTPWWCNVMYSHDFFELEDQYGAPKQIWGCPGNSSYDPTGPGNIGYDWNSISEAQARADSQALTGNAFYVGPAGDPDNPTYTWPMAAYNGGVTSTYNPCFVDLNSYSYMGANIQTDPSQWPPSSWFVYNIYSKTSTGTPDDSNPPLMCDCTVYQPGGDITFNHGTTWSPNNPSTGVLTNATMGDVRINVLHVDGSVENKPPDPVPYMWCFAYR